MTNPFGADEVRRETEALRADIDRLTARMTATQFVVTDQSGTVEVTTNGRARLTNLRIDERILALGAQEVAARINEAMEEARLYIVESVEDEVAELGARIQQANRRLSGG